MQPYCRKVMRPSKTAELAAAARADHTRNVSPPVFEDILAHAMCGPLWRTILSSKFLSRLVLYGFLGKIQPIVPAIYMRARFGEDCLEAAVREGLEQYVIIGAGYDTFALRRVDLMKRLKVWEIDQAATQDMKLRRMQAAGFEKPKGVQYVQSDLDKEDLHEVLKRTGFDFMRPVMISWFGVTYYLNTDTIQKTLSSISVNMAPGSTIVFDYLADPTWMPDNAQLLHKRCADFVARRGEPWISSFNPPDLPGFLGDLGYAEIDNLEPDKVADRYSRQHPQLEYPSVIGLCRARTVSIQA